MNERVERIRHWWTGEDGHTQPCECDPCTLLAALAQADENREEAIRVERARLSALWQARVTQAERALEDEIVKLRADVVWIAQQRDENEQWARDRATVAIQMADERDAARAEVERLKNQVIALKVTWADSEADLARVRSALDREHICVMEACCNNAVRVAMEGGSNVHIKRG